jgi:class 3 adenylate cyclase
MEGRRLGGKIAWTVMIGNLLGAVTIFVYFTVIDPDPGGPAPATAVTHFVLGMLGLGLAGVWLSFRWMRPLRGWAMRVDAEGVGQAPPGARQAALLMPWRMAAIAAIGWTLAGLIWGVLFPVLLGTFSPARLLRSLFGTTIVGGSITTVFIFLVTERLWRPALPAFFPRGDLARVAGVPRLTVRTRLLTIFLLVGLVPPALLGLLGYRRAAAIAGAEPLAAAALLDGMLAFTLFMLGVGGLGAGGLAFVVSRSVAGPLHDLEAGMRAVGEGRLETRCPVVSTDEIGAVTEGFNTMVEGLQERERLRETFGKYVSREIRDEILAGRVALSGQLQEATILFADLRDFTPWVEATPPEDVVRDLNEYFTLMEGAVRAHGGLVLQYIGDEIEAVFGAPVAHPDHARRAVAAALEMRRRLAAWNAERARRGRQPLANGIGIHTGRVLAGSIGSPDRLAYALVGDPVNLASRIQGLTRALDADLLVSGETRRRVGEAVRLEPLPAVRVKGKSAEVEVYRIARD